LNDAVIPLQVRAGREVALSMVSSLASSVVHSPEPVLPPDDVPARIPELPVEASVVPVLPSDVLDVPDGSRVVALIEVPDAEADEVRPSEPVVASLEVAPASAPSPEDSPCSGLALLHARHVTAIPIRHPPRRRTSIAYRLRMAWIHMLEESEVFDGGNAHLARLYRACLEPETGRVDRVLKVHSLAPLTMDGHLRLYTTVMKAAGETTPRERELLAVVVSAINACAY
jgi:hypothetical protein